MGASTQAMQRDDALNPAMLWVLEGEQLWHRRAGAAAQRTSQASPPAERSLAPGVDVGDAVQGAAKWKSSTTGSLSTTMSAVFTPGLRVAVAESW